MALIRLIFKHARTRLFFMRQVKTVFVMTRLTKFSHGPVRKVFKY
jgi:hypothetical protein